MKTFLQRSKKSDRSPSVGSSQSIVKLEYPGAPHLDQHQHQQHTEFAQDAYHNQTIASMGSSYSPIGYLQTQYGMVQPIASNSNQPFMLTPHSFTAIADKPIVPMEVASPIVASLAPPIQPVPEILHRDAIITSTQSHIQNQLQRKHEELQQLIMKQQEEVCIFNFIIQYDSF